jgi:hypothetical protein
MNRRHYKTIPVWNACILHKHQLSWEIMMHSASKEYQHPSIYNVHIFPALFLDSTLLMKQNIQPLRENISFRMVMAVCIIVVHMASLYWVRKRKKFHKDDDTEKQLTCWFRSQLWHRRWSRWRIWQRMWMGWWKEFYKPSPPPSPTSSQTPPQQHGRRSVFNFSDGQKG